MNNTPPKQDSKNFLVVVEVCPKYSATKLSLCAFLKVLSLDNIPKVCYILPIISATVLFPLPGGPSITVCKYSPSSLH